MWDEKEVKNPKEARCKKMHCPAPQRKHSQHNYAGVRCFESVIQSFVAESEDCVLDLLLSLWMLLLLMQRRGRNNWSLTSFQPQRVISGDDDEDDDERGHT